MYLDHFKLTELPFRLSPDPQFLYLSAAHSRAKAYMESTVMFTDGFVVITGEIGAGKTTVIETFLRTLDADVVVAQVNQTQVSAVEFLQTILVQFGFSPFKMKKAELISTINTFLIEQFAAGRKVLLVVDEAQNLSLKVLEEIRLLSGIESTKEKVLRIILAGQPELNEKLDSSELIQLAQRVRLRFHLSALTLEDMKGYIRHRLDVAGAEGRTIFESRVFPQIFRYTGGVPRLINTLCDTAMMAAFSSDTDTVTPQELQVAITELQWVEFAARTHTLSSHQSGTQLDSVNAGSGRIYARIVLRCNGQTISETPLRVGRRVVGRTTDNDVQIDSRFVSRHHCQLLTTERSTVIEDLNSTNGIHMRGRRIRRQTLRNGDVITIGQHELLYGDERISADNAAVDTIPGAHSSNADAASKATAADEAD
ncbi:MAG: AAA family ATPase [Pseudomonadales bacterium]|nr:AAA family ATPase [Pseudomonadales bacterium]